MCVAPEALNFSGAPEVLKAVLKSDIKWLLKNRPQPLKCMHISMQLLKGFQFI